MNGADVLFYIIISEIFRLGNNRHLEGIDVKNTINPETPPEIM
jgi:hypothetical protein